MSDLTREDVERLRGDEPDLFFMRIDEADRVVRRILAHIDAVDKAARDVVENSSVPYIDAKGRTFVECDADDIEALRALLLDDRGKRSAEGQDGGE